MKYPFHTILLLSCVFILSNPLQGLANTCTTTITGQEPSTLEVFSRSVFAAVSTNNPGQLKHLFMTSEDRDYYFREKQENSANKSNNATAMALEQRRMKNLAQTFPKKHDHWLSESQASLVKLQQSAKSAGVNLAQSIFIGLHTANNFKRYGIPFTDIYITARENNTTFVIKVRNTMCVKRGWILTYPLEWEGAANSRSHIKVPK